MENEIASDTLLGRTAKLKETKQGPFTMYELDDREFEDEGRRIYGSGVVFLLPGTMIDARVKPGRVKVKINDKGVVYDIRRG